VRVAGNVSSLSRVWGGGPLRLRACIPRGRLMDKALQKLGSVSRRITAPVLEDSVYKKLVDFK